eukprot:CAMPEP_0172697824 /NCGR_PEP_ID=MMETSP1074-20121228/29011_1 /TAXON_ID=2916 /ORGANISM="Ceratium fusus, Strain PA161109" /LENGTH=67 /DNA_ID=CAMNT_0013518767 /DNA_START=444 /DNA_END=643 /DNA_ORIENTATION=-
MFLVTGLTCPGTKDMPPQRKPPASAVMAIEVLHTMTYGGGCVQQCVKQSVEALAKRQEPEWLQPKWL